MILITSSSSSAQCFDGIRHNLIKIGSDKMIILGLLNQKISG